MNAEIHHTDLEYSLYMEGVIKSGLTYAEFMPLFIKSVYSKSNRSSFGMSRRKYKGAKYTTLDMHKTEFKQLLNRNA